MLSCVQVQEISLGVGEQDGHSLGWEEAGLGDLGEILNPLPGEGGFRACQEWAVVCGTLEPPPWLRLGI